MSEKRVLVWGMMTGTSCDGLDVAAMDFQKDSWLPLWGKSFEYPAVLRKKILELQNPSTRTSVKEIFVINRELSEWYAKSIKELLKKVSSKEYPDLISNHGQTIAHFPKKEDGAITVQLGDPSWIVNQTGITVVSHFREGDVSAGGQGAPLANHYHSLIIDGLKLRKAGIALHNLGGISNFSYFSPKGKIISCDTGPANIWIDAAVEVATGGRQHFDEGGKIAQFGKPNSAVLNKLLKHPYLSKKIPKTTGRDDFPIQMFIEATQGMKPSDRVATATEFTAETIAQAYKKFITGQKLPLKKVIFSGGGTKNETLMELISNKLPKIKVMRVEDLGLDSTFIEPQAFAYLGYRTILGAAVGGEWTGVKDWAAPGWITPGKNWLELVSKINRI